MRAEEIKEIVGRHTDAVLDSATGRAEITAAHMTFSFDMAGKPSLSVEANYTFAKDTQFTSGGEA